jgi:uncharacterized membrane protein
MDYVQWIEPFVNGTGLIIDFIGIVYIVYASLFAGSKLLSLEVGREKEKHSVREGLKRDLAHKLIFGFDFLIAGDVLRSVIAPTPEKLMLLGGIVIIRVILSYSLLMELGAENPLAKAFKSRVRHQ